MGIRRDSIPMVLARLQKILKVFALVRVQIII